MISIDGQSLRIAKASLSSQAVSIE